MANDELIEVIKKLTEAMNKASDNKGSKASDSGDGGGGGDVSYDPATAEGLRRESEQRLYNLELLAEEQRLLADTPGLYQTIQNAEQELAKIRELKQQAMNENDQQAVANLLQQEERINKIVDANRGLVDGFDNLTAAQKRARVASDAYFSGALKFFGLGGNFMSSYVGKFVKLAQVVSKGGPVQFFKSLGTAMLNIPLAVLATMVEKTISFMLATDAATKSVQRAMGGNDRYNQSIAESSLELGKFGIEAKDTGDAFLALNHNVSSSIALNDKAATAVAKHSAKFAALGVSVDTTQQMIQSAVSRGLGVSEAIEMTEELRRMGSAIGMTTKDMMTGFQKASATLAVYGPRMQNQVFGKLAAAAKAAGISIDSLLTVAGKFDTFDQSAKAVASLNAVLGTQFSQTEMLVMKEDEKIERIMQEFKMKGIQFSQLDRFQQKLVAQQLGFKNVDEAAKLLNGTFGEYKKNQALAEQQAKKQEKVDEAMRKSEDVRMKMKIWFHGFVSEQGPAFLAWLQEIIPKVISLAQTWGPLIVKVLAVAKVMSVLYSIMKGGILIFTGVKKAISALSLVSGGFNKIMTFMTGLFKKDTIAKGANTTATSTNAGAVGTLTVAEGASVGPKMASGHASRFSAKGMLMMAGAFALILGGVGVAAAGIAALAQSIKGLSDQEWERLKSMLIATGVAILGLGIVIAVVGTLAAGPQAAGILTIAAAFFLIGAGVGFAAAGLGLMAAGFALMASTGTEGAIAVLAMAGAIIAIGVAFSMAGIAIPAGAALTLMLKILGVVAVGIIVVIAILAFQIGTMIEKFTEFFKVAGKGKSTIGDIASGFFKLAGAMTLMGNPLALMGMYASIKYMKQQAKSKEAMARIAEAEAELAQAEAGKAKAIGDMMALASEANLSQISASFLSIASAVKDLDMALGKGQKRIQIIRVLETLTAIQGDDISTTALSSGVNKLQVSADISGPKRYSPESFDISVAIGRYEFEPVVKKIISRYARET